MGQIFNSPEGRWWSGLIRGCLYVVIFERNPLDAVDRVYQMILDRNILGATPQEYVRAIREALNSEVALWPLVVDGRVETEARLYIAELARRLDDVRASD